MKSFFSNKYIIPSLFLIGGILLGWLFFHSSSKVETENHQLTELEKSSIWTCSMHPQIRMHEAGDCPICGMDLIPIQQSSGSNIDPNAIHLTKEAVELANVQTSIVSHQKPMKEVRLYGKIQADERLLQSQVAHVAGRIEKLMVNFTGESVRKGQTLALIYSPQLISAQQELIEAAKLKQIQPEIYEAAKARLHEWKLTEKQISEMEMGGNTLKYIEIVANTSGVITTRRVNSGDYVAEGDVLFEVANLNHVWLMFDAYESDLPFLSVGNKLDFSAEALPGSMFSGAISFVDPVLDPVTRVAKVRVEMNNELGKLKPEMFVNGVVKSDLSASTNELVIPRSAVLWTGKRSIVYVKDKTSGEAIFKLREIELGESLGNSYVVLNGLADGEEIVTEGAFSVDAAAQLEGKSSMMNEKSGDKEKSRNKEIGGNSVSKLEFTVAGSCSQCKERIETAALSVEGVSTAVWDVESKEFRVEYFSSKTSVDQIKSAILHTGHDVELQKADENTYNELPACCKYRDQ